MALTCFAYPSMYVAFYMLANPSGSGMDSTESIWLRLGVAILSGFFSSLFILHFTIPLGCVMFVLSFALASFVHSKYLRLVGNLVFWLLLGYVSSVAALGFLNFSNSHFWSFTSGFFSSIMCFVPILLYDNFIPADALGRAVRKRRSA